MRQSYACYNKATGCAVEATVFLSWSRIGAAKAFAAWDNHRMCEFPETQIVMVARWDGKKAGTYVPFEVTMCSEPMYTAKEVK
jgi:hypothetical protein